MVLAPRGRVRDVVVSVLVLGNELTGKSLEVRPMLKMRTISVVGSSIIGSMWRYDLDDLGNRDPERMRFLWDLLKPFLRAYFRPVILGLDRVPEGPALYVGNHNGIISLDSLTFFGEVLEARGIENVPYGLGHEVTMSLPGANQLYAPLGVIRASHGNAHRVFAAGGKVMVYPGSDYDAYRAYRDRDRVIFGPRRGYIRLALRERVPIVPVITAGAHEVCIILDDGQRIARALRLDKLLRAKAWPITLSIPWGLTVGPPQLFFPLRTRFYQEALAPIVFKQAGPEAASNDGYVERCHQVVHETMQRALDRLVALRAADRGR